MKKISFLSALFCFAFFGNAQAFPQQSLVPGGIAIVELEGYAEPSIYYNNEPVLTVQKNKKWFAITGIPLSAKIGSHKLVGKSAQQIMSFSITNKDYPEQYITLEKTSKNKRLINPNKADMERIAREKIKLSKALAIWSKNPPRVTKARSNS